jgi:soluble lytic murein transglycosylase-like protein
MLSAVLILLLVARSSAQQLPAEEKASAYEPYMAAASARYGVDPKLLWTIAYLETRFNPSLVSPKGARGLMQFVPSTGRKYGLVNPFDPELSIDAAARYLRDLSTTFNELAPS